MIDSLGGYFELELRHHKGFPHDEGVLLNTGRNAFEYVLRSLPCIRHLWMPYYTCSAVLEPVKKLGVPYSFYHIDNSLEIKESLTLDEGDYLVYTNYFGIKDDYVCKIAEQYGTHLIVDNAQAWFAEPIPGVSTIYSPRKFVGVPDGGIAFCPYETDISQFEQDCSYDRCSHLLKRIDLGAEGGFEDFKSNDLSLSSTPIRRMSKLTKALLSSIDFDYVRSLRRCNFEYLDHSLSEFSILRSIQSFSFQCPLAYPFWTQDASLRKKLIDNKLYVATYWPNVKQWTDRGTIEYELADQLIPLPVDQRYGIDDMKRIIEAVLNK